MLPVAFLRGFLDLIHVHSASYCLEGQLGSDQHLEGLADMARDLGHTQIGYSSLERILAQLSSADETALVYCSDFDLDKDYPGWAFEKNVIWLVGDGNFTGDSRGLDHLRLDSNFFACSHDEARTVVDVDEVYRVKGGPLMRQAFGTWRDHGGKQFTASSSSPALADKSLWERRSSLGGVELTDTFMSWPPISIHGPPGKEMEEASGIAVDLIHMLQDSLNFTTRRAFPKVKTWGVLRPVNETYKKMVGMIGELNDRNADLSTTGMSMILDRFAYIDMVSIIKDYGTLILPKPLSVSSTQIDVTAYMGVFSGNTWLLLLCLAITIVGYFGLSQTLMSQSKKKPKVFLRKLSEGVQVRLDVLSLTFGSYQ